MSEHSLIQSFSPSADFGFRSIKVAPTSLHSGLHFARKPRLRLKLRMGQRPNARLARALVRNLGAEPVGGLANFRTSARNAQARDHARARDDQARRSRGRDRARHQDRGRLKSEHLPEGRPDSVAVASSTAPALRKHT